MIDIMEMDLPLLRELCDARRRLIETKEKARQSALNSVESKSKSNDGGYY